MSNDGISSAQVRAARALLRMSQEDLADASGVSLPTVIRMERHDGPIAGRESTIDAVRRALEKKGAIFIDENGDGPGVRLKKRRR